MKHYIRAAFAVFALALWCALPSGAQPPFVVKTLIGSCSQGGNDAFTKILLHADGANGSTTFVESSGFPHTWTPTNNTLSTAVFKFGTASNFGGASAGGITTNDSTDFTLGSGNFTVDFWLNANSQGTGAAINVFGQNNNLLSAANTSIVMLLSSSTGRISFFASDGANLTAVTMAGSTNLAADSVTRHIAVVRNGSAWNTYVNGTSEGSATSSITVANSPNRFSVGQSGESASNATKGYIDEFRLSVGVARWTANFTPPSKPYC